MVEGGLSPRSRTAKGGVVGGLGWGGGERQRHCVRRTGEYLGEKANRKSDRTPGNSIEGGESSSTLTVV